jgi:hypothetical protein
VYVEYDNGFFVRERLLRQPKVKKVLPNGLNARQAASVD